MLHYLEISARQSGKTERLVRKVYEQLTMNPVSTNCTIFVCNYAGVRVLQERLTKLHNYYHPESRYFGEKIGQFMNAEVLHATAKNICSRSFMDNYLFFDEFDFYDGGFWNSLRPNFDFGKSYFATTPSRFREMKDLVDTKTDDQLIKLLQMNNFDYSNYPFIGSRYGKHEYLSPDQYLLEIESVFIR